MMIYILDDEKHTCELISYALQSAGFNARCFLKTSDFWDAVKERIPKLVILDIMMPDEDGLEVIRKIREDDLIWNLPVIFLTAKSEELDIVKGLNYGADDYITKPFAGLELLARIRSVLRRAQMHETDTLNYEGISVNPRKHLVTLGNNIINLTPKEYDILLYLMKHQGEVIPREALIRRIWGFECSTGAEDRIVDTPISTLRSKLEDAGAYIRTVRGIGYCLGEEKVE